MTETECIKQIAKSINNNARRLIAVAGGSCTGKTSLIKALEKELHEPLSVIHLDDFQTGADWQKRKSSVYGWDDPEHFSIPEMDAVLAAYQKGNDVKVPVFSLKENRRTGNRLVSQRNILLTEGLYVLPPYFMKPDIGIYMEAPFFVRLVRRIVRFLTEVKPQDRTIPLRHMIMNTYPAHKDFVIRQKPMADYCVESVYTYDSLHFLLAKLPACEVKKGTVSVSWGFFDGKIRFAVKETEGVNYFSIVDNEVAVYEVPLAPEWVKQLLSVDMFSV